MRHEVTPSYAHTYVAASLQQVGPLADIGRNRWRLRRKSCRLMSSRRLNRGDR